MKRKRLTPDDPREWIRRAKSNLAIAISVISNVDLADLCFDAQQAAEKAIKAVFVKRGETFPFSHDLHKLLHLLEANGHKIPQYINAAKELTQYAHMTRYPGMADPVTQREYRRAVRIAEAVLRWAERQVETAAKKQGGKKSRPCFPTFPVISARFSIGPSAGFQSAKRCGIRPRRKIVSRRYDSSHHA